MTTNQSASLAVHGEVKRGKPHLEPKAPPNGGAEDPNFSSERFTYHLAFVTIGQTPRSDIVPEMLDEIAADPGRVHVTEHGVLDGLDGAALDAMRAAPSEAAFATRLADGSDIAVSVERTEACLDALLQRLDGAADAIVMLCTGTRTTRLARSLVIEAQRVVDGTLEAVAAANHRLGVIVPLARQVAGFAVRHGLDAATRVVAASPYTQGDFELAAEALADCDLIVMHCMGFDRAMQQRVMTVSGKPVLLARSMVAGAVRQLL